MNQKNHSTLLAAAGVMGIDLYRALSSCFPARCRYAPTCSEYARQAVLENGLRRGGWLALRRLLRCHPFAGSGYDPVPGSSSPCREI